MKPSIARACRWLMISGFLLLLSGCGALSVAGTDNLQAIASEGHYQQPIHAAILDTGWHTGWVARAILWKRNGPEPIMREPWYPHGLFFTSTEPYDAFHTCNNWTAQSLHVMGFPVSSLGIFFAGQVQGLWKQIMREKKPAT